MTVDLTRLLAEIAGAQDMAEVSAIVDRNEDQIKALPARQYEQASELIADAIYEYRDRNKI
jgi:hypothetical protein